ncbi:ethylene-responsive transcription factor ERF096-like [Triticum dicoccoides]|uniref:ethylene-responsive transcription factor ERF096-like n=1 Tax=Triticum dicoccoides TaxID=85692 RepID=UPI00188F6E5E|nr:ethylene-responsive transcription factor ERF096-like [Triticum dicoccoides]
MAPKKTPKGKSGFFGVRQKPSGKWGVEFTNAGRRCWIGTYPSAHEAARAYDVAVWRAERPRSHLNFPEIESRTVAEMLVPQGINMKEITTKKPSVVVSAGETDEEAMARFAREHPEYVQAEMEHYWKREVEHKQKGPKKEDEAGPSMVIPVESSSEEDWADYSEEEEEGCDDPTKDEFWEQFRSSGEEQFYLVV